MGPALSVDDRRVTKYAQLTSRLHSRRGEIEHSALERIHAVADPRSVEDPGYVSSLHEAVGIALEYSISSIPSNASGTAPVPELLTIQARRAARSGVSLDTVLRRYLAGYTLLSDFLIQEAEQSDLFTGGELKHLLRAKARLFDQVVASVSAAWSAESVHHPEGIAQRRARQVEMLLSGELVDIRDLGYEMEGWHLGAIASGPGARDAIKLLGREMDRQVLLVATGSGSLWAWFGGREKISSLSARRLALSSWPSEGTLVLGEPGRGLNGWRLSHRQAGAANPIALRGSSRIVRYTDVSLLAATISDKVLADSLFQRYLGPLREAKDGGGVLLDTLGAFLTARGNVSSAAAAMKVSRQTVNARLRTAEKLIGQPVGDCVAELATALRLDELSKGNSRLSESCG